MYTNFASHFEASGGLNAAPAIESRRMPLPDSQVAVGAFGHPRL